MSFEEILGIYGGFAEARILHEAVLAGLFDETVEPRTADAVADALGWDADATTRLLDALTGMELLDKEGGRYRNVEMADTFLVEDAERTLVPIIRFNARQWEEWGRLGEALRTGETVRAPTMYQDDPELLRDFIHGMRSIALGRGDAEAVPKRLDLEGDERVLDLGGGPGTYSRKMLEAHPDLEAVLFDLPNTLEIAEEIVATWPDDLPDRIELVEGDYRDDPLPDCDLAWVSNIVHSETTESNRELMAKLHDAISPGGRIAIKDHLLDEDLTTPRSGSVFAIVMLLFTGGRCYSRGEVRGWLEAAGFEDVETMPVVEGGVQEIMVGRR